MNEQEKSFLEKVKIIQGDNYATIEDTNELTTSELKELVNYLDQTPPYHSLSNLKVLVNQTFSREVDEYFKRKGYDLVDEFVTVYKKLEKSELEHSYTLKNLHMIPENEFVHIWMQAMESSLNAPSSLTMEEHMKSVQVELGDSYKDSCIAVYEGDQPIGVMMPHIEPGTGDEGRLFYFGLIPDERSKGRSKILHKLALNLLASVFHAKKYIGGTSKNNAPMIRTFLANGCEVKDVNRVFYKKSL
ncbi:GNAT family N-acetyltransferase [Rossellomorea aquimaris]|uniref:GNAT family N-acetyltransferase n=1 Tax=Rossellomorea aquimaris TaxID=189382 RepID=UPI0006989A82|nr:GNAT family N-acetyltransferase [Rossellomorea aquimaris]